ncbi:hypothetical protein ACPSKX_08135 [Moritella viscosa]
MHEDDRNRVVFHSSQDITSGYFLPKVESILKRGVIEAPNEINDVLELYNIKLYIDNGVYLKSWSDDEVEIYKNIVQGYRTFIGGFISKIDDSNVLIYHKNVVLNYVKSFWELINNQRQFKKISPDKIEQILIKT